MIPCKKNLPVFYFAGYCVYLFLILFTALCLCGMTFIDTWLGIWLNAAASQVKQLIAQFFWYVALLNKIWCYGWQPNLRSTNILVARLVSPLCRKLNQSSCLFHAWSRPWLWFRTFHFHEIVTLTVSFYDPNSVAREKYKLIPIQTNPVRLNPRTKFQSPTRIRKSVVSKRSERVS